MNLQDATSTSATWTYEDLARHYNRAREREGYIDPDTVRAIQAWQERKLAKEIACRMIGHMWEISTHSSRKYRRCLRCGKEQNYNYYMSMLQNGEVWDE